MSSSKVYLHYKTTDGKEVNDNVDVRSLLRRIIRLEEFITKNVKPGIENLNKYKFNEFDISLTPPEAPVEHMKQF